MLWRLAGRTARFGILATRWSFKTVKSSPALLLLLTANILIYCQGRRHARRARAYALWRTTQDLDAESLRSLLGNLPAWVKFEDYEQARFVNQALHGMWPYLDTTICSAIKEIVEPIIQENIPFPVSAFTFEKLALGDTPFEVRGVKHASLFASAEESMALAVIVDAAWFAEPDIVARLAPARRWRVSHVELGPATYVRVDYLRIEGRLRLTFPVQTTLPIFNSMSISFLDAPKIDLSLKMLGGVDIMSMPALQDWLTQLIKQHVARAMTFPASVDVPFVGVEPSAAAAEHLWPRGIAIASLERLHLPRWRGAACMPSMVLQPATWADACAACDVHAMTYPLVMDPQRPSTLEHWQAAFPITDARQVLNIVVVENTVGNKGFPVTTMPLPLAPLIARSTGGLRRTPDSGRSGAGRPGPRAASPNGAAPMLPVSKRPGDKGAPVSSTASGLSDGVASESCATASPEGPDGGSSSSTSDEDVGEAEGVSADDGGGVGAFACVDAPLPARRGPRPGSQGLAPGAATGGKRKVEVGATGAHSRGSPRGAPRQAASEPGARDERAGGSSAMHRLRRLVPWQGGARRGGERHEARLRGHHRAALLAPVSAAGWAQRWHGSEPPALPAPLSAPSAAPSRSSAEVQPSGLSTPREGASVSDALSLEEWSREQSAAAAVDTPAAALGARRFSGMTFCSPRLSLCHPAPVLPWPRGPRAGAEDDPDGPWTAQQQREGVAAGGDGAPAGASSSGRPPVPPADATERPRRHARTEAPPAAAPPSPLQPGLYRSATAGHRPRLHHQLPRLYLNPLIPARFQRPGADASEGLAFEEMWAGRSSAWDISALRQGLLSQYSPSSADAASFGSAEAAGAPSHSSQDNLPDLALADSLAPPPPHSTAGRTSMEMESPGAAVAAAEPAQAGEPPGRGAAAAACRMAPLVASARVNQRLLCTTVWLPDADGATAAMGVQGAYIMMRHVQPPAWARRGDARWSPDLLRRLPPSTLADMRHCAAAALSAEAAGASTHPHPLIRSYNLHRLQKPPSASVLKRGSTSSITSFERISRGGVRPHRSAPSGTAGHASVRRAGHAAMLGLGQVLCAVRDVAMAPVTAVSSASITQHGRMRSHLLPDIEEEGGSGRSTARAASAASVSSSDVLLESSSAGPPNCARHKAQRFHSFAGCAKVHLQWLPLQWTFLAEGRAAPPPAQLLKDQRRIHTGVLAIQLLRTSLTHNKVHRPQVMLQLDHLDTRHELRRTGVRERWARRKSTLRHGIVDWRLKFSFCVDIDAEPAARATDLASRSLQVELVEVAASLKDRMRAYWTPDLEHARGEGAGEEHGGGEEGAARESTLMGATRIPLAKLVAAPNRPCQAIWQLLSPAAILNHEADPPAVGTVALEFAWLPAADAV